MMMIRRAGIATPAAQSGVRFAVSESKVARSGARKMVLAESLYSRAMPGSGRGAWAAARTRSADARSSPQ